MKFEFSKNKILTLITGPFFIAIPVTLLNFLLFPPDPTPYNLNIIDSRPWPEKNSAHIYVDLNNDSIKERLYLYNYVTFATAIAYTTSESIYETWNLRGDWFDNPAFEIADINNNGIPELLSLTITKGDSVLAGYTELSRENNAQKFKFVTKIKRHNGERDLELVSLGMNDITGDGVEDLIFIIAAGFTLQPRAIYAWDIKNDIILRSPFSGMNFKNNYLSVFQDVNNDNIKELFLLSVATDNYKNRIPYSDTASFAVVFTEKLEFLFPPVYCSGKTSQTRTLPIGDNEEGLIFSITLNRRENIGGQVIRVLSNKGKTLKQKRMLSFNQYTDFFPFGKNIITSTTRENETEIISINSQLKQELKLKLEGDMSIIEMIDIDLDKEKEIIIHNMFGKIGIIQPDFQKPVIINTGQYLGYVNNISLIQADKMGSTLYVQTENNIYTLSYIKNSFYRFRYLLIVVFYLGFSFFLMIIQKIFIFRNNQKKKAQEKIVNYQLQSVMNQLNPHFTFNAINSIGGAILKGNNEEAYNYFTKLSGLIRKSMYNAFQPYKTLEEEIQFVREYLEIEQYRFEENLNWSLEVEKDVNTNILIPKMLIHIFAENAIKHGIFHKESPGNIDIRITANKDQTTIKISDDGVGIQKASELRSDQGNGIKILKNYLGLFEEIQNTRIEFEFHSANSDLINNPGTEVIISIQPTKN